MPNWVKNRLTIEGENSETVLNDIMSADEDGERFFDFNKIIPMPESLKIIYGTVTDKSVALYLTAANPNVQYYGGKSDKVTHAKYGKIIEALKARGKRVSGFDLMLPVETIEKYEESVIGDDPEFKTGKTRDEAIAYGKRAVDNVLQYGHMNWYDWAVENWGTKWNALNTYINDTTIEFDTAWADVSDLMCKLSEKYPRNYFYYDFAEEQPGLYAGSYTFEDGGEIGGGHFDEHSKEAFEKYFELWGGKDSFKYNKRTKTYEFIESKAENSGSAM